MEEDILELPLGEKIKGILKKPLIICVTPQKKGDNFLKGGDYGADGYENSGWNPNATENGNTGWSRNQDGSGCSPCCSPCSPCLPNTNRNQCGPDDNRCYPQCSPCNPCYPCNPVEEYDRDRR